MPVKLYDIYQCENGLKVVPNANLGQPEKQLNISYKYVGLYVQENAIPPPNGLNAQILTKYVNGEYATPFDLDIEIEVAPSVMEPVYVDYYPIGITTAITLNTNSDFAAMLDEVLGFTHAAIPPTIVL